jgi:hypothetical protein
MGPGFASELPGYARHLMASLRLLVRGQPEPFLNVETQCHWDSPEAISCPNDPLDRIARVGQNGDLDHLPNRGRRAGRWSPLAVGLLDHPDSAEAAGLPAVMGCLSLESAKRS